MTSVKIIAKNWILRLKFLWIFLQQKIFLAKMLRRQYQTKVVLEKLQREQTSSQKLIQSMRHLGISQDRNEI